jgi:hypothetical protein
MIVCDSLYHMSKILTDSHYIIEDFRLDLCETSSTQWHPVAQQISVHVILLFVLHD